MTSSTTLPEMPASDTIAGEKIAKQLAQVRMAHEAVMLEDAQAVLKQHRQATANLPQQLAGENIAMAAEKQSDGMVHIGDIQYVLPAPKAEAPAAVVSPAASPAAAGMSTLAKLGVAALVGGPIGLGLASIPVVSSLLIGPAVVRPADPVIPGGGVQLSLEPDNEIEQ